ncbi:hypothetical protein SMC26_40715 [Actinomadura fulvescens]|uniref:hypothetical protein n=1 Tax=Actinomadura fulvescens TaxID=46160 RepID=UPI0031D9B46A
MRDYTCGIFDLRVSFWRTVNNVWTQVGWIDFAAVDGIAVSTINPNFAMQQQIDSYAYWGEVAGAMVQGAFNCTGVCRLQTSNYPSQPMTLENVPLGTANIASTATAVGAVGNANPSITIRFSKPGYTPSLPYTYGAPEVRCDNDLPGASYRPGCANSWYESSMKYGMSGPYPQLAKHLKDAQDSGLPGFRGSGTFLNRITGTDVQRNRDRACPTGEFPYPRPDGKSCDEYPMASTKQGAMTANPDIPPRDLRRTFTWCDMPDTVPVNQTGRRGYSICMIDETQNSNGGVALEDFYITYRILPERPGIRSGDAFTMWLY